jgi:chromate reductase
MPHDTLHVLGLCGSLRKGSYNRKLLRAAQEQAPDGMEIDVFDLFAVPLYDADVEAAGDPDGVAALKEAIRAADAVLIATPEYQHSMPGVLKNALDWASRPPSDPPLARKPVAVVGATPGRFGTARAQVDVRKVLAYNDSLVLTRPEVMLPNAGKAFDGEGRLTNEVARRFLAQLLRNLAAWTRHVRGWQPPEA